MNDSKSFIPPVPDWKPGFRPSTNDLIDRFSYYTDNSRDFVVLRNGTLVLLEDGLDDLSAGQQAEEIITSIYNYHPDMDPRQMDDGNILVFYNHPAFNIALDDCARNNWEEIDMNHLRGLCTHEVLITPLGHNVFDEVGKKALWARCYLFMDVQDFGIGKIVRNAVSE